MPANTIDIATIVGYFVVILFIGLRSSRGQQRDAATYFTSRGSLPWWAMGMAYVSTGLNSEQLIGMNGMGYFVGLPLVNSYLNAILVFTALIFCFFPVYLRNNIITMPQYLEERFDKRSANVFSVLLLISYVFLSLAVVLYGGAKLFEVIYEVPLWQSVLVLGLISGVFTIFGGMSSMVNASVFQFVLMFLGGGILFYLGYDQLPNGWQDIMDHAPGGFHLMQPADTPVMPWHAVLLSLFNLQLFYSCINQALVQRGFGGKTEWDVRMAIVFALVFALFRPFLEVFPGLMARALAFTGHTAFQLTEAEIDNVYPLLIANLIPAGLQGLIIVGILSTVMSTIAAFLNSISTLFTYDVYKKWINPAAGDRKLVSVGMWCTFVLMAFSILYAPVIGKLGGIFIYFQSLATYLAVPVATCFLAGMFWKRATPAAALVVLVAGIPLGAMIQLVAIPALFSPGFIAAHGLGNFYVTGGITQVFCVAIMVAVSLFTPPRQTAEIKRLMWTPAMISLPTSDPQRPWWQSVGLWWGIMAIVYGVLYWMWW
ncbi:sodium/sugar symporter [Ravibacter arvi]|uniref:Sodium/sugar symporter n=1 Tax=Ravibacter arvi TaxID=2051041 RepID=A0ABP8M4J8_9BACT